MTGQEPRAGREAGAVAHRTGNRSLGLWSLTLSPVVRSTQGFWVHHPGRGGPRRHWPGNATLGLCGQAGLHSRPQLLELCKAWNLPPARPPYPGPFFISFCVAPGVRRGPSADDSMA